MDTKDNKQPQVGPEDGKLVDAAKRGDGEAFNKLIRVHYRRCVEIAAGLLRNRGEAEEEAQNACWKAFKHLNEFWGESQFPTWLHRIVQNQCLMLLRRKRLMPVADLVDGDGRARKPFELPSRAADPEGMFGFTEVVRILRTEIRRMPPLFRTVLLMHDMDGLPISGIATHLGITVAAAKSRLGRARNELRQRMLRHCVRSGSWSLMVPLVLTSQDPLRRR